MRNSLHGFIMKEAAVCGRMKPKPMKVTRTKPGTTHVLATCSDCAEMWDDYKTADTNARKHAETTGHTVNVEHAQCWTYKLA